ncbi:MAG: type ISP restriction/modification enzyme, partial [Chloroflexota bacterium]|nr:type ISP restriction/modification enzyme [Chloroflexota bacterium]
ARQQFLEEQGLKVLRFTNEQVMSELESVLESIVSSLPHPSPHLLPPSPQAGRGDLRAPTAAATTPSPKSGRGPGGGVQLGGGVHPWQTSPDLWKKLKPLAREKRKYPTDAEEQLWQHVRKKQLQDYKFRRQHTIDRFIVDFYCRDANLIVEVDGPIHQYTTEEDAARQQFLEEQGLKVLRFTNEQVMSELESVLESIVSSLPHPSPHPLTPSPQAGRGDLRAPTTIADSSSPQAGRGDSHIPTTIADSPSPKSGRGPGGGVHRRKPGSRIYYADLWGRRANKHAALNANDVSTTDWEELTPKAPHYFFVPKDFDLHDEYKRGWSVTDIFPVHSSGIKTHRDDFVIGFDEDALRERIEMFRDDKYSDETIQERFELNDTRDWNLSEARNSLQKQDDWDKHFNQCLYRPFDIRPIYYSDDVVELPRFNVMRHMLQDNLLLLAMRQVVGAQYTHFSVSKQLVDDRIFFSNRGTSVVFPLYLYNNTKKKETHSSGGSVFTLSLFEEQEPYETRRPNISRKFLAYAKGKLELAFIPDGRGDLTPPPNPLPASREGGLARSNRDCDHPLPEVGEGAGGRGTFGPEDIFNYAYAVFHSPTYRQRYAEFLKIDFPRLPLTSNLDLFRALAEKGRQLVSLHLMESKSLRETGVNYHISGPDMVISRHPRYHAPGEKDPVSGDVLERGRVYINKEQYFEGITPEVWEFQIGGYQVLHKWLK